MHTIRYLLQHGKRLLFDGAIGTELQKRGLPPGQAPELYCMENPHVLESVHRDYCQAGADVLTTNTFGGTAYKLPQSLSVYDFNRHMAAIAKKVASDAGRPVFVAGSIGPTGQLLAPLGSASFDDLVLAFTEQIKGLLAGGADLLIIETQYDIAEARAAVLAARKTCTLPIAVSMTYEEGITLTGSSVAVCTATLANMGVDLIAMNCSAGPVEMEPAVAVLLETSPLPVLVQPNAGLPILEGEKTVFPLGPEEFAALTVAFAHQGVQCVGGCCGTSPRHIAVLRQIIDTLPAVTHKPQQSGLALTSRLDLVRIGGQHPFCLIGERINPTGKKLLTAALQAGEFELALQYAEEQSAAGAKVLDVNVGAAMVDEVAVLPRLVHLLSGACELPLAIDSSNPDAIAAALSAYPASPLVNSISGEPGKLEQLGPLCRDYGAPFILLPLSKGVLPARAKDRIAIIETLLDEMEQRGIPRRLAMVDILALTVSSDLYAAKECLEVIRYCRDSLHLPTVCGLSNISFGLPARDLINANFLVMAAGAGLTSCIANPSAPRVQEALHVLKLLQGYDEGAEKFIGQFSQWQATTSHTPSNIMQKQDTTDDQLALEEAVIRGDKRKTLDGVQQALAEGQEAFALVNDVLIPAITKVGDKYERKEYFLPQLIRSAEAMQSAFAVLQPLLAQDNRSEKKPVIILATVEGDIHDIGKNIVGLLLSNHGFDVIDLGKDVTAERIVDAAEKYTAPLIGLSALMTTTMVRMQDTITLLQKRNMTSKVLVGGAVVTEAFARNIGAFYSHDAVGAVRLANSLLESK